MSKLIFKSAAISIVALLGLAVIAAATETDVTVNCVLSSQDLFDGKGIEYSLHKIGRTGPTITFVRTLSGEVFIEGSLERRDKNGKIVHGVPFINEKGEMLHLLNGTMIDAGALEIEGNKLIGGKIKPLYGKALIINRTNTLMIYPALAAGTKQERGEKGEKPSINTIDISKKGKYVCIEALQTITIQEGKWRVVEGECLSNVSTGEGEIIEVLAADKKTLYPIKPGQCGAVLDGHIDQ